MLADFSNRRLRLGEENDLFNFAGANHDESVNLASWLSRQWATSVGMYTYQRGSVEAGKFVGSVSARLPNWGALTAGGAIGHDRLLFRRGRPFFIWIAV